VVVATECDPATLARLCELVDAIPGVAIVAGPELVSARLAILVDATRETPYFAPLEGELESHRDIPGAVEVLLLGRVEIRGVDATLARRPKLAELVAWFAAHPRGAAGRIWSAAIWPDREVPAQTVANRLSEARRMLGFASDDLPRLRRDGERHLLVDVATDWDRFRRLCAPDRPSESWRRALELVRGRPFEDLVEGQWAIFEGLVADIEQCITATALRLGDAALEQGDADLASWAAQQALRAAPYDERLHRLLMHAADRAGNRAALESVLSHLALVLEIDGDPLRGVHPETAALYQRLSGSSRAPH
jgi:DNA-binding SARP family transcriptional activator